MHSNSVDEVVDDSSDKVRDDLAEYPSHKTNELSDDFKRESIEIFQRLKGEGHFSTRGNL